MEAKVFIMQACQTFTRAKRVKIADNLWGFTKYPYTFIDFVNLQ